MVNRIDCLCGPWIIMKPSNGFVTSIRTRTLIVVASNPFWSSTFQLTNFPILSPVIFVYHTIKYYPPSMVLQIHGHPHTFKLTPIGSCPFPIGLKISRFRSNVHGPRQRTLSFSTTCPNWNSNTPSLTFWILTPLVSCQALVIVFSYDSKWTCDESEYDPPGKDPNSKHDLVKNH